jgi:putative hydrolase of the HAD superfamily
MALHSAPIDAVLFDYGMVLSGPPNADAWARMRAISGLSEDALHREYWAHRHPYDRGDHNAVAYWHLVGQHNNLAFTDTQIAGLIDADTDLWGDLNLPMVEWARQLQQAGIRTGILSNIGDAMAAGLLGKHAWLPAFDHHTWSYTLNLAKPEPAIYRHAAEGLATPPDRILFIDDRADNIEAARHFGMQTVQYLNHAQFLDEMQSKGLESLLHPRQLTRETTEPTSTLEK